MKLLNRLSNILIAITILLALVGVQPANASASVAAPYLFSAGSLIIPMDLDPNGQDMGMLRAYGLVYQLLRNNVPVHWVILSGKPANGNDFTIGSVGNTLESFETNTPITLPRSYRGGPFVIADTDAAAALPIIQAWQSTAGDNTEVHELTSGSFTPNVAETLINAPRIAILQDGNESVAFNSLNAAGIRDSAGGTWGYSSPDLLTESQVAGPTTTDHADGALLHQPSGLTRYCYMASMHYNDTATTPEVVQEVRSWLTGTTLTHAYMQCESIQVFENDPSGHFLTTAGLVDENDADLIPVNRAPDNPLSQIDGIFEKDSGSTDWIGLAGGSSFKTGATTLFNKNGAVVTDKIILLSGQMDGTPAGNGKVTYLGGHDYSIDLPVSTNLPTNGIRIFLNSIFASGCATNPSQADMTLTLSAPATIDTDQITYTVNYSNPGSRPVENVTITNVLPPNTTYITDSATIAPTSTSGGILTWDLPALASGVNGSISFTVNVSGDLSYSNTASVQFAHLTVHNISSNTVTTLVGIPTVLSHTLQSSYPGTGPSTIAVTFSNNVNDPVGNSDIDDVTNPNNYFIVEKGTNGIADTISCVAGVQSDDALTLPASVNYIPNTAILNLNTALPAGNYRLFVCGTSSIVNPSFVPLAGDGVTSGTDFTFDFTVGTTTAPTIGGNSDSTTASSLPGTGFAPNKVTSLPAQPATSAYSSLGDIWLEIPSLNVKTSIVGVPQNEDNSWNVDWLGDDTGWLNGTAFPTWVGNSVLTAHVTNADGLPGLFSALKKLKYGDQIIVHLFDQQYIFEIQNSRMVRPYTTNFAFASLQDHSYLTLITCQGYMPFSDTYLFRRVVRAVLVEVR